MIPIYEQMSDQIRKQISTGELKAGTLLPSVRACARDYHISALTAKKAYDLLESEGFVKTVQGKGTYVQAISAQYAMEEQQKQLETLFEKAIEKARQMNMSSKDILELVHLLLEETNT